MEPIECASCMAEAPYDEASSSFDLDGWDLDGEFGIQCPKCVQENGEPAGPTSLVLDEKGSAAIAEVFGAKTETEES